MRSILLCAIGFLFGCVGLMVLQNLGLFVPRQRQVAIDTSVDAASEGPRASDAAPDDAALAALERRIQQGVRAGSLEPVAVALDDAKWDADWSTVERVAAVLRQSGASWLARPAPAQAEPETAPAITPTSRPEESSPVSLRREAARQALLRGLRAHDNAATRLRNRADPQAVAVWLDLLGNANDAEVVGDAALLLAQTGDERGLRGLLAALESPRETTRTRAAHALAVTDNLEGAERLAGLVARAPDEARMAEAALALGGYAAVGRGLPQHPATRALVRALGDHATPGVRAAAASALGTADLDRAELCRTALLDALGRDLDASVRRAAAQSLERYAAEFGAPAGAIEQAAARLAEEQDPRTQSALVGVLSHGGAAAVAALELFAPSAHGSDVAQKVAQALAAARARSQR